MRSRRWEVKKSVENRGIRRIEAGGDDDDEEEVDKDGCVVDRE